MVAFGVMIAFGTTMRWVRLLVSVVVLVGALAVGAGGAVVSKAGHSCVEMAMDDCPDKHAGDGAALPQCQDIFCGPSQSSLPNHQPLLSPVAPGFAARLAPRDDSEPGGLRNPPDLRPPIV